MNTKSDLLMEGDTLRETMISDYKTWQFKDQKNVGTQALNNLKAKCPHHKKFKFEIVHEGRSTNSMIYYSTNMKFSRNKVSILPQIADEIDASDTDVNVKVFPNGKYVAAFGYRMILKMLRPTFEHVESECTAWTKEVQKKLDEVGGKRSCKKKLKVDHDHEAKDSKSEGRDEGGSTGGAAALDNVNTEKLHSDGEDGTPQDEGGSTGGAAGLDNENNKMLLSDGGDGTPQDEGGSSGGAAGSDNGKNEMLHSGGGNGTPQDEGGSPGGTDALDVGGNEHLSSDAEDGRPQDTPDLPRANNPQHHSTFEQDARTWPPEIQHHHNPQQQPLLGRATTIPQQELQGFQTFHSQPHVGIAPSLSSEEIVRRLYSRPQPQFGGDASIAPPETQHHHDVQQQQPFGANTRTSPQEIQHNQIHQQQPQFGGETSIAPQENQHHHDVQQQQPSGGDTRDSPPEVQHSQITQQEPQFGGDASIAPPVFQGAHTIHPQPPFGADTSRFSHELQSVYNSQLAPPAGTYTDVLPQANNLQPGLPFGSVNYVAPRIPQHMPREGSVVGTAPGARAVNVQITDEGTLYNQELLVPRGPPKRGRGRPRGSRNRAEKNRTAPSDIPLPMATERCHACTEANVINMATYGPPGSALAQHATRCKKHKGSGYVHLATGGKGGRPKSLQKAKFMHEHGVDGNKYHAEKRKKEQQDAEALRVQNQELQREIDILTQQNTSLSNNVHRLQQDKDQLQSDILYHKQICKTTCDSYNNLSALYKSLQQELERTKSELGQYKSHYSAQAQPR